MNIYIVLAIQVLFSSATHLVAKSTASTMDPVVLTLLRGFVSVGAFLLLFGIQRKSLAFERCDFKKLLWLSFIAIPINQFLFLYGIKFTPAANGALLYATTPAIILLISRIVYKEPLTRKKVIGVVMAFAGVLIIIFEKGISLSSEYTFGNVLIFLAVISWALYSIHGKPLIIKYGAMRVSALAMIGGTLLFIPIGITNTLHYDIASITAGQWQGILYLGIGTSVIAYVLWYYAIGKIDTAKVAVFANAQPIVTSLLSVVFLHQVLSLNFVVGGIITIAGVVVTQRK